VRRVASYATVSLVRESPEVLGRFVDYYHRAGASELLLYWDGPAAPDLAPAPRLTVIVCDEAFWQARGGRPEGLEERQSAVYLDGLARCASEWALIVDADEFVFGDRRIPDFLDAIPRGVDSVSLPSAEAVWGPGDPQGQAFASSYFRLPWRSNRLWSALRRPFYGGIARYMQRGLAGHTVGKQFLRARQRYSSIRNHAAERDGARITRPAASLGRALEGMYLGHFDAIDFERWSEKWQQRIGGLTLARRMTPLRNGQMRLIAARMGEGERAARSLFARFYRLSRPQYALLASLGYAFRREIFRD
jgi:hypothetical protein